MKSAKDSREYADSVLIANLTAKIEEASERGLMGLEFPLGDDITYGGGGDLELHFAALNAHFTGLGYKMWFVNRREGLAVRVSW